jgi:hypothetical protein
MVFLSSPMQMWGQYHLIGHNLFLPDPFQLIHYRATTRPYRGLRNIFCRPNRITLFEPLLSRKPAVDVNVRLYSNMSRPQNRAAPSVRIDCLCIDTGPECCIISDIVSAVKYIDITVATL